MHTAHTPLNNNALDAGIAAWFGVSKVETEKNFMRSRMAAAIAAALEANTPCDHLCRHDSRLGFIPEAGCPVHDADAPRVAGSEHHGLDTAEQVCFYEQDFYVLSNFSAFNLLWHGINFHTSEAAYHWEKFAGEDWDDPACTVANEIMNAPSAHEAFKIAERNKHLRRPEWDAVKVDTMRDILRAKAEQHEYVRRKLLATGDRKLVENSWRDAYWGWGPKRDGKNMLGQLWMEVRAELRDQEGGAA